MIPLPMLQYSCDGCTVCCEVMGVEELNKRKWEKCQHAGIGCHIYETRPQSCREFQCMWLQGLVGDESTRPDKLGLMFRLDDDRFLGRVIVCHEVYPGALEKEETARYLYEVAKIQMVILTTREREKRILGPLKELVEISTKAKKFKGESNG